MKRNAFSLAELVICLAIIGIISSLTLSSTQSVRPNSNMILLKKAYKTTTEVVADMITISAYYPNGMLNDTTPPEKSAKKILIGDVSATKVDYEGESKFCSLFVNYMNTTGDIDCTSSYTLDQGGNFTTNDGIVWSLPITDFNDPDPYPIEVDINGAENPNCNEHDIDCKDPDQFKFYIDKVGRISIEGAVTTEYLSKNTNITKK